ncbi:MAG: hypothetical protein WC663_00030 [Patescibacteria group bacterium]|jgi:NDP-sugar pyrophosphorylase family protein
MPRPPISCAVASLREYYLSQGEKLADLRFQMTTIEDGSFEIVRVDEKGRVLDFHTEVGIATVEDPAWRNQGVYYLRPDNLGQFHLETTVEKSFLAMERHLAKYSLDYSNLVYRDEDQNTYVLRIDVNRGLNILFSETFAKTPAWRSGQIEA